MGCMYCIEENLYPKTITLVISKWPNLGCFNFLKLFWGMLQLSCCNSWEFLTVWIHYLNNHKQIKLLFILRNVAKPTVHLKMLILQPWEVIKNKMWSLGIRDEWLGSPLPIMSSWGDVLIFLPLTPTLDFEKLQILRRKQQTSPVAQKESLRSLI